MGATEEFRRLLEHAAERLAAEDEAVRGALMAKVHTASNLYHKNAALARLTSWAAATTYAQLVMDMTARFLTDDDGDDLTITTANGENVVLKPGSPERAAYDVVAGKD